MSKPSILISINTLAETEAARFGRRFMEGLCKESGRLVPELVSTSEKCKDPFIDIENFLSDWWAMPVKMYENGRFVGERYAGPFWKRKSALVSRGYVKHGLVDVDYKRTRSSIWYQCRWDKGVGFNHLFDAWANLSCPEIGMLHVFTEPELQRPQSEAESWFETGSFGGPFKPGLPNIGWAMAYGKEFVAEVDASRIRAAGFAVDERDGFSIVRVTDKLSDVVDDFAYFSHRRAELKALFRRDLFWITDEPTEI
jgi:hypothetical protein